MPRICIAPRVEGLAGVASFRLKFENGLSARGVEVTHDLREASDAVLVLAGTRKLIPLWKARARGSRIVQRLDGINWVHRARWAGLRYTVRAVYGNLNLSFIRRRLANRVIYQSHFIKGWWEDWYRATRVPSSVILNGVDLGRYNPNGLHERPTGHHRILDSYSWCDCCRTCAQSCLWLSASSRCAFGKSCRLCSKVGDMDLCSTRRA